MTKSKQTTVNIMSFKKILIIAGVVLFLVAGNAIYALLNNRTSEETNNQASSENNSSNPLGVSTAAIGGDYQVTIGTTSSGGTISESVAKIDSNGNLAMTVQGDDGQTELRYIGDKMYSKDASGTWVRVSIQAAGTTPEDVIARDINLGFGADELASLNSSQISDKGKASCRSGMCRVYEFTNQKKEKAIIKVDDLTNRVSEIEITSTDGEVSTLAYDYDQSFDVTAPDDYTELPL